MVYSKWLVGWSCWSEIFSIFLKNQTWNIFDGARNRLKDVRLMFLLLFAVDLVFFLFFWLGMEEKLKNAGRKKTCSIAKSTVTSKTHSIWILSISSVFSSLLLSVSLFYSPFALTPMGGKQIYNTKKTKHELEKGATTATIWYMEWETERQSDRTERTKRTPCTIKL